MVATTLQKLPPMLSLAFLLRVCDIIFREVGARGFYNLCKEIMVICSVLV